MKKAIIVLLCIISNMYYTQHNNPLKDEMIKSLQNDDLHLFIQLTDKYLTNMLRGCKYKGDTKDRKTILECDLGSAQELEEFFRMGINKGREIIKNPNTDLKKKLITIKQMPLILGSAYGLSYMKSNFNIEYSKEQNKDLINSVCSGIIDIASSEEVKDKLKDKDDEVKDIFKKCLIETEKGGISNLSSSPTWIKLKKETIYIFK